MNRVFRSLSLFALLAIYVINCAEAQTKFSIHVGGSLPFGKYADYSLSPSSTPDGSDIIAWNVKTEKAGAAMGLNLGVKLRFNLPSIKGLGIITTADFFFYPSNKDIRDSFEDYIEVLCSQNSVNSYNFSTPKYFNIPILLGLNYELSLGDKVKVYGEGGAGVNIGMISSLEMNFNEQDFTFVSGFEYKNQYSFAFQVGVGVLLSDQLSLGVHYYNLGSQSVKGLFKYTATWNGGGESERANFVWDRINPNMITLRLGYHF